jgi:ribosomal protein S4
MFYLAISDTNSQYALPFSSLFPMNRRCTKTPHKKYRRYGCDIWGRLAIKKRDNFITKLVYNNALSDLRKRLKNHTKTSRKRILRIFRNPDGSTQRHNFAYRINKRANSKRNRTSSRRGLLLKLRRKVSLYYGGGRIRIKTFRRYGRMILVRKNNPKFNELTHYELSVPYNKYASIIESRIDVLLLRSNFVDSVYKARSYIFKNQCKVFGNAPPRVTHPGFLVKTFQLFGLNHSYTKKLRKSLMTRVAKHAVISIPGYLFINFSLLVAFKFEEPFSSNVTYSFDQRTLAHFRKCFYF